ncbi:MAG: cytochrome b/b6 domain-containing protein [Pseudomonadota bacterium]
MAKVLMFTRFERIWHWSQAFLIISMLITGFEIHGVYTLFGFEQAVDLHIIFAWTLIGVWIFAIFWHMTTGEWKQYIPSSPNKMMAMLRYYGVDIILGGGVPYQKTRQQKLNPMERLELLLLHVLISPVLWISGLLYLFYTSWNAWGLASFSLGSVALVHTAGAFAMLVFLISHLYFSVTTSKEPFGFVKAMITGYENE